MTAKTECVILAGGCFGVCGNWCGGSPASCRPVSVTRVAMAERRSAMIVMHHLNNSRSQRVLRLLEDWGALRNQVLPEGPQDQRRAG